MPSYSYTDTFIVWSDNKDILRFSAEIAKELKVQVYQPPIITDLIAIPCFLKIIDSKYLVDLLKHLGSDQIEDYFTYDETKMLVFGNCRNLQLGVVKSLVEEIPPGFGKKLLFRNIKANLELAKKDEAYRKKQYKKRLFRFIYLYHLISNGECLNIEKLAGRLNVDNRTFGKDIQTLRGIVPTLGIFFEKKGHAAPMRAPRKRVVVSKPGVKEKQFIDSVIRIINLYQMLKKEENVQFSDYYGNSEQTDPTSSVVIDPLDSGVN